MAYTDGTNQIAGVKVNAEAGKTHQMEHDMDGNVIRAAHKNIETIEYNRTSQKPTSIRMTDGTTILFFYDAQGERILKRVTSSSGVIIKDIYYVRDDERRILLERQITRVAGSNAMEITTTVVTMYIHGPRGLIGFIRNDVFHSVITDHVGSVRLIVRDGQVVAAIDYLPYGKTMRLYYTNPQDLIAYRYAGQEFDDESELYNYHGRLYDPNIGRFYELDPQAQYHSPYKHTGGNSFIDSDDKSAIKETVTDANVAISKAYTGGGSAVNGRWDPGDRKFRDSGTNIGIIEGGMAGTLLATGVASDMFLTASAANGNWDPEDWKWDSPQRWNGLFQGFATEGGVGNAPRLTYTSDVMADNGNAAFWEWDLTNPNTWHAILSGFDSGNRMPNNLVHVGRSFRQLAQTPDRLRALLGKIERMPKSVSDFTAILNDPTHPLYNVALLSASADYFSSETNWKNTFTNHDPSSNVFFARDPTERISTAMLKRKPPKPEMVDLISYQDAASSYRVRRLAMVPNDEIYLNVTSKRITSTVASNHFVQDEYKDPVDVSTSGSSRVSFWPLTLFRTIKSQFLIVCQYLSYGRLEAETIPLTTQRSVAFNAFQNYLPDDVSPGVQFDEFGDNSSILQMGDRWFAETNMHGNLLWAFMLMRKLFGQQSHQSKLMTADTSASIASDIQAYEIVTEFFQLAIDLGVNCGIEEIIDSGRLDYLFRAVKTKLLRCEYDDVGEILLGSLVGRYKNEISLMSSPKQADWFEGKFREKIVNLNYCSLLRSSSSVSEIVATPNVEQNYFSKFDDKSAFQQHFRDNRLGFSLN